jgi:putative copper resistance protein D
MAAAVVLIRMLAFAASVILFGTPLFLLYSLPPGHHGPPVRLGLAAAAALVLLAAIATLLAQTAVMAGDAAAALDPRTLFEVLAGSVFGTSVQVRSGAGFVALILALAMRPRGLLWAGTSLAGAAALAALAWGGHGAADTGLAGLVHTASDIVHLLAAGAWLGALVAFALLLREASRTEIQAALLLGALQRFAKVGSVLVAAILATGLVNSAFMVGPGGLRILLATAWGWLLLVKLALFAAMLRFAALNRFRFTPDLEAAGSRHPAAALRALRRSVDWEAATGLGVLVLVAVLGVLPPPAAG